MIAVLSKSPIWLSCTSTFTKSDANILRYYQQALSSLQGNLPWLWKLMWMKRTTCISAGSNSYSCGLTIQQVSTLWPGDIPGISATDDLYRRSLSIPKLLFSLVPSLKGYTSHLLCARCGNLRQRTQKWDRSVSSQDILFYVELLGPLQPPNPSWPLTRL